MEAVIPLRLSEQLREKIEEGILTGVYSPGDRLDEGELAQTYGVSRTPIREALFQLSAAGFLDMRPRRGAMVADVPASRLCEMFDVMAELEAMCGRLAARRAQEVNHKRITETHEACVDALEANDTDAYYRLNQVFHEAIYEASRNAFLVEQTTALSRRLRPYRRLQLRVRNRMQKSFEEHSQIVRAIVTGDAWMADELLRNHVVVQGERFADMLVSLAAMRTERKTKTG
jgi:DNA-binding GntR family transcriptional regulator